MVKVRFFTIADYEDEERWLRRQHQKGLRLVKCVGPCFYVFEACTPEDVIYRLDYQNERQSGDYLQLFRDYGWEYFASCMGWLYFRKPASEVQLEHDGEIFSDGASRVDMIRHIVRTRMLPLLWIFCCCVLPNWWRAMTGDMGSAGKFFVAFFTFFLFLYLYLFLHCGLKLRRIKKRFEQA